MKFERTAPPEARLLQAATALFCREGIHATGVTLIIAQAQVARRTLYERFGSKDNLLRAVFDREGRRWFEWFDETLPARWDDPSDQLVGLFDLLAEWFASSDFYGCIFINAAAEHHKEVSWVVPVARKHLADVRARVFALVKHAGLEEPDFVADELSLLIDGAIVAAMMMRDAAGASTAKRVAKQILQSAL